MNKLGWRLAWPSAEGRRDAAHAVRTWLSAFVPAPIMVDARERWRGVAGALLGVLATALISRWLVQSPLAGAWMVAPLGASAVLVFGAPASPLAQPWSVVGGNGLSALVGVACATLIADPLLAGAVAVSVAMALMMAMRCLHPPGGAMALSVVLAHAAHGHFAFEAAMINSVVLVTTGVLYNAATGRRYPHTQLLPRTAQASEGDRFKSQDLDAVLARYNQVLDVSRDDLEGILHAAELEGYRRRMGAIRCRDVMSGQVITVQFGSSLNEAWQLMREHRIKALPVVDMSRRIVGIITLADFMRAAGVDQPLGFGAKLREFLLPDGLVSSDKPEVVGQIMTRQVRVTSQDVHAVELMPLFTEAGHHHIPVIDDERRIVGIITQSDFVRALYRAKD